MLAQSDGSVSTVHPVVPRPALRQHGHGPAEIRDHRSRPIETAAILTSNFRMTNRAAMSALSPSTQDHYESRGTGSHSFSPSHSSRTRATKVLTQSSHPASLRIPTNTATYWGQVQLRTV